MQKKNLMLITTFTLLSALALGSCSEEQGKENPPPSGTTAIAIAIESKASLPDEMTSSVYIFRQEETGTYKLADQLDLGPTGQQTLELENEYLTESNIYRFLFVATHTNHIDEISINNTAGNPLQAGTIWEEIRLEASSPELSGEFFYAAFDRTGTEIFKDRSVTAPLARLTGQPVIDIFKTEKMDIEHPVDKLDTIGSVLDRVYRIEIQYTGLTRSVKFEGTTLVEDQKWDEAYLQTINPEYNETEGDHHLKVFLPQEAIGLATAATGTKGSARIMGIFGMPATETLRILATFHYSYLCDNIYKYGVTHEHTPACYEHTLELNLPKADAPEGLNILANTYTVNKAGLPFDRVIDIRVKGEFSFILDWDPRYLPR